MTEKAFPRERFNPQAEFVVNRPILMSGETIPCGTAFDKTLVDLRRLRQLYDQRYLRLQGHEKHIKDPKPNPYHDEDGRLLEMPTSRPKIKPRLGRVTTED